MGDAQSQCYPRDRDRSPLKHFDALIPTDLISTVNSYGATDRDQDYEWNLDPQLTPMLGRSSPISHGGNTTTHLVPIPS